MENKLPNSALLAHLFRHDKKKHQYKEMDLFDDAEPFDIDFHKEWSEKQEYIKWKEEYYEQNEKKINKH